MSYFISRSWAYTHGEERNAMAIRAYRIAVVGCPRSIIEPNGTFNGVGKSCFCNRFVKPEAYSETHRSIVDSDDWTDDPAINCDHFLYWGATTRRLQDGSKVRFQVVEQTEFYDSAAASDDAVDGTGSELRSHPSAHSYLERACSVRIATNCSGKVAVRLKAEQASARAGGVRSTTQIFPKEDFGGKSGGIFGFICIFDPTLEGERMKRQLDFLSKLLPALNRTKKKVVLVCTKCDVAEETQIKHGANLATSALRRPLPFFEVSSRDNVNVEDIFFTLIGQTKKTKTLKVTKSPKSARHCSISYKDAVSMQRHDINLAKDNYRRLLQRKITSFSTVWSEAQPILEKEPESSVLLQLAGKEGNDMVKNMFCLRLIEIKLTEGAKYHGLQSATRKLNQDKSRQYQKYLSSALKSHPDLK